MPFLQVDAFDRDRIETTRAHASFEVRVASSSRAIADVGDDDERWRMKSRHFIACTRAGKPSYARYGDLHALAPLCAALCALFDSSKACDSDSNGESEGERLKVNASALKRVELDGRALMFKATEHMLYVMTSAIGEQERAMETQLEHFKRAMESLVTNSALEAALRKNSKFDVARALDSRAHAGTFLGTVIRGMSWDTTYVFNTYRSLTMGGGTRKGLTEAIRSSLTFPAAFAGAVFGSDGRIAGYAKPKGNRPLTIAATDMIVMMSHARVMREVAKDTDGGASFERLCLPAFNANGFMHAYVAPLSMDYPDLTVCFLTANADAREQCEGARETLVKKLDENKSLSAVIEASATTVDIASLPPEAFGGFTDAREPLLHFVYNRPVRDQHVSSTFSASLDVKDVKTLTRAYAALYASMTETDATDASAPKSGGQRVRYEHRERFNILSCVGGDFEIYLTLKSTAGVVVAVALCNRLCVHLRLSEPELFLPLAT